MRTILIRWMTAAMLLACAWPALAHQASDAFLQLDADGTEVRLRVDVALRDLDAALSLDADGDGRLTWREVREAWPSIEHFVRAGIGLPGCSFEPAGRGLERRVDGAYAVLHLHAPCSVPAATGLRYTLFAGVDATHRGLLRVNGGDVRMLDPAAPASKTSSAVASFVETGARHIVGGVDHVLFLICLMLPAVMRRTPSGWQPVARLRDALLPVAGIVTAFTLAHSITLGLAATRTLQLPASFVEPAIAVTIILAALDNLRPVFGGRRGLVTFVFGLVHGFGFAEVLAELSLPPGPFALALLQFNVGLELGQLAIVLLVVGVLFGLRRLPSYPAIAIRAGSWVAGATGLAWLVERTADVSLLPI